MVLILVLVFLSSVGEILENESGKYQIIGETKEIDPSKTLIASYSERTGLITMVKKSDHKKIFKGIDVGKDNLKGGEKNMDENLKKMLETFGVEFEGDEINHEELLAKLAEKLDTTVESIKESVKAIQLSEGVNELDPVDVYLSMEQVSEKLGAELSAENVLKLAKEGQDYHALVIEEAIAMGVRAQGNDFTADTWKETFAGMSTKAIKDISKKNF